MGSPRCASRDRQLCRRSWKRMGEEARPLEKRLIVAVHDVLGVEGCSVSRGEPARNEQVSGSRSHPAESQHVDRSLFFTVHTKHRVDLVVHERPDRARAKAH